MRLPNPKVSVLLPIYGGERYLRRTLDCLLAQTFSDFEIIAVNDASPDASRDIVLSYRDPRIRLLDNPRNLGQTGSLQRALQHARGEYLARQDQDDLSLPERFARQVAFLDQHPEIGVVGTHCCLIDERDNMIEGTTAWFPPETVSEMAWRLLWNARLVDSSVMFRRRAAERVGGYDLTYRYAQDHDLWVRLSFEVGVARLPDILLQLRIHSASASSRFADAQARETYAIVQNTVNRLISEPISLATASLIKQVQDGSSMQPRDGIQEVVAIIRSAFETFAHQRQLSGPELTSARRAIAEQLVKIAVKHRTRLGLATLELLVLAWSYYPRFLVQPALLISLWRQKRQARRYRQVVSALWTR